MNQGDSAPESPDAPLMSSTLAHPGAAPRQRAAAAHSGNAAVARQRFSPDTMPSIDARGYYAQYHGHPVEDLASAVAGLRSQGKGLVWLAGDSSLGNYLRLLANLHYACKITAVYIAHAVTR